jgi:hypothetical protein
VPLLKESIRKAYGKKGEKVVMQNCAAVDGAVSALVKIDVPAAWANAADAPEGRLGHSHTPAAQVGEQRKLLCNHGAPSRHSNTCCTCCTCTSHTPAAQVGEMGTCRDSCISSSLCSSPCYICSSRYCIRHPVLLDFARGGQFKTLSAETSMLLFPAGCCAEGCGALPGGGREASAGHGGRQAASQVRIPTPGSCSLSNV